MLAQIAAANKPNFTKIRTRLERRVLVYLLAGLRVMKRSSVAGRFEVSDFLFSTLSG